MPKTLQFPCTYSRNWNIWKKNSLYYYLEIPFPESFKNFYFWQIENLFSKVLVMESINLQICSRIFEIRFHGKIFENSELWSSMPCGMFQTVRAYLTAWVCTESLSCSFLQLLPFSSDLEARCLWNVNKFLNRCLIQKTNVCIIKRSLAADSDFKICLMEYCAIHMFQGIS